ncbi:hypothetical protein A3Q56_02352 [Intoshia linei]|uniref:Transposase IS30-like HTH domain-containing protein n=1 Tax=Intoshia linei TaxID=1819745 RepID=A0A177B6H2_9BILA|nr:hypothetical protein A3Q56_02352 [Intoshia linei]
MTNRKNLTQEDVQKILRLKLQGKNQDYIANEMGRSQSTICQVLQNKPKKKKTGRPLSITETTKRLVVRRASNNTSRVRKLTSDLNLCISPSSVYNIISSSPFIENMPSIMHYLLNS